MRFFKALFIVVAVVFVAVALSGCTPYEYIGKEISTIEYTTIKYFGDYRNVTIIDFESGDVLNRKYFPTDEVLPEYTVIFTFDVGELDAFLDDFGASGVLDMKDEYETNEHIDDGGGWIFTINYLDGTSKTSNGDNYWPEDIFEEADIATVELYEDDLFGTSP